MTAIWAGMIHHCTPPCGCSGGAFSHVAYVVDSLAVAECAECGATIAVKKDDSEAKAFAAGFMTNELGI